MRVTESRLAELSKTSLSQARQRLANTQEELSSGLRVSRPSQGTADWARGEKARARAAQSEARGQAIDLATTQVQETDRALDVIGSLLSEARSITVQGSNNTLSASDRANLVAGIQSIRQQALSAANSTGPTGEFLLAGSQGTAPFDATGNFVGDNVAREIEVAEGQKQRVNLTGGALTAGAGVDLFATLNGIETALAANDPTALRTFLPALEQATEQISAARSTIGGQLQALRDANDSRQGFEESLARVVGDAQESDIIEAASALAQGLNALETAKASSEKLFAFLTQR